MKLIVFDFDGTLIEGRLIDALAQKFDFVRKLENLSKTTKPSHIQSLRIASLLKGTKLQEVLEVAQSLPLMLGIRETFQKLRTKGYNISIISCSYRQAIEVALEGLPRDYVIANELMEEDGTLTGDIRMPLGWAKKHGCLKHSVCKLAALRKVAEQTGAQKTVAVGNGDVDVCMVEAADLGIAFSPNSPRLVEVAKIVVEKKDLREILKYVT